MPDQRLPVEVWGIIVEHLPPSAQKSCLSVSRLLHDLAIRPLFSMIKVCLCWHIGDEEVVDEVNLLKSRTLDMLQRIVSDRKFASLVKKLVVFYYHHNPSKMLFERQMLAKAISSMSQLVTFQWVGAPLKFPEEVTEAIASFCPRLRELALPANWIVYHPLLDIHNLHALRLRWSYLGSAYLDGTVSFYPAPNIMSLEDNHDFKSQIDIIDANRDTLRELDLLGPYLSHVPIRIFNSLTHLEIYVPQGESLNGLPLVFHHASGLESLVLVGDIWSSTLSNVENLPHLSSFHLSTLALLSSEECQKICDFIRGRVSLRRLCLRAHTYWSNLDEILAIIKDLPALRTLGLHIDDGTVDLEFLALHLPPTLESLHLALYWDAKNMNISFLAPLLGVLQALPNLTFLHLFGLDDLLPVTAEYMARHMKRLRIVGKQHRLWDILRIGNEEKLLQWNFLKTVGRIEEDFSIEDGAWLLKYF